MGELNFISPVDNSAGDRFGDRGGRHKGIDYYSPEGTSVKASERGKVVRASMNPGNLVKRSYGNVIIIDHTPNANKDKQHVYTLYAHLSAMSVGLGDMVIKGEVVGATGNTGTKEFYEQEQKKKEQDQKKTTRVRGMHLHFEVIDTGVNGNAVQWNTEGYMNINGVLYRQNPLEYIDHPFNVHGTTDDFSEEEKKKIVKRLSVKPEVDFSNRREPIRLKLYLDGNFLGYLGKGGGRFTVNLTLGQAISRLPLP